MTLKDNSPVTDLALKNRCRAIQRMIDRDDFFLVDLLDPSGQRKDNAPAVFREGPDGRWWTGNYVGVFAYSKDGQTTYVTINSRFDPKNGTGFVPLAMLEACWNIPLRVLEEYQGSRTDNPYDLLLVTCLAVQLERAWTRGQLRVYRSRPMYDSRVQGRLDLPRQIRESVGLADGRMAYAVREYSGDNDYNRLFRLALLEAEKRCPDFMRRLRQERPQFRLACRALLQQASGWGRTDRQSLLARTKKRIVNPIYREYEALRVTSRNFLQRMGGYQSQTEAGVPFVTGVFLDISQLWERYLIESVFKRIFPKESPKNYYQQKQDSLEQALTVRPDFWWRDKGIVLDAKYRPVWAGALDRRPWPEGVRENVYQVLSYMLLLNCGQGGVIYPTLAPHQAPRSYLVSPRGDRGQFWRVCFTIPQEEMGYEAFLNGMKREADLLAENLRDGIFRKTGTF